MKIYYLKKSKLINKIQSNYKLMNYYLKSIRLQPKSNKFKKLSNQLFGNKKQISMVLIKLLYGNNNSNKENIFFS